MCVPRTTQGHYLEVRKDALFNGQPSPCYSQVGGGGIGRVVMNLPGSNPGCFLNGALIHEQGHAFGLAHEHQRADRDDYILVNFDLTTDSTRGSYEKYDTSVSWVPPLFGPYDFLSVMHYGCGTIGGNFIITPLPQFSEYQQKCGAGTFVDGRTRPTPLDHEVLALFYRNRLVWGGEHRPRYAPTQRFDREDFLTAMERLHAFYMSREGLHRQEGLSIGGRPDFLGIATWIFDVYLGARSAGWHHWSAFDIVVASVTQTDEWRTKNPGLTPIRPDPFSPSIRFDRAEFLDVLQRLDAYYASPEGLQRQNGLSIANGPDFLGIATWVFDVYLNERLRGTRPETAWSIAVRAIENTDEWKQKHRR
jgi:hypothetical protein